MAYRLIVADSSPSIQKVIQMAFSQQEFEVFPFEDGQDMTQAIERINPDAILLSLSLSGKDGYEAGAYLKNWGGFRKTTLVFLKDAFEPLDQDRIAGLEYDEIVQKPFDSEKLARMVRELMDRKKGPITFPEEFILEEIPAPAMDTEPAAGDPLRPGSQQPAELPLDGEIGEKIRQAVREEILAVERELEKRLKASLLRDLKGEEESDREGLRSNSPKE